MKSKLSLKITSLTILLIILIITGCKNKKNEFNIDGNIIGLDGKKVFLKGYTDSGDYFIDSSIVINNKFELSGVVDEPQSVDLLFLNNDHKLDFVCSSFYLENSEITINGDINNRGKIKVDGSREEKIRKQILNESKLPKRFYDINNQLFQKTPSTEIADTVKKWTLELEMIRNKHKSQLIETIKSNSNSYIAINTTLSNLSYFSSSELKNLMESFPQSLKTSKAYLNLIQVSKINTDLTIGKVFKNFDLNDSYEQTKSLANFNNKLILIDFWASWCGPCKIQFPELKKIYNKYHEINDFQIIGVSIDENISNWKASLHNENLPWPNVNAPEKDWAKYNYLITSIPYNFLLDHTKKILAKDLTPLELEQFLIEYDKK